MNFEPSTTWIAPSALHLSLYRKIIEENGSCLNQNVMTLDTWLAQSLSRPRTPLIRLLYEYSARLDDLSPDNLFYASRRDYDFLRECENFMLLCQLYDLKDFPVRTRREKDLKEIIDRLMPVKLWVDQAKTQAFEGASSLRILLTESTLIDRYWIRLLVSKGAHVEKMRHHKRFYYWSCSNARKEMEVCADAIVRNKLDASTCMIALADPEQRWVLARALESRGIPFTFIQNDGSRKIVDQWKSALIWVMKKDDESLMALLETLYPMAACDLRRYLRLFGNEGTTLQSLTWRPNALISEETFLSLQALEVSASQWKPVLESLRALDLNSIDTIGRLIMDQSPDPSPDDLNAFEGVMNLITAVRSELHKPEDLALLIRELDNLQPSQAMSELNGVLIGSREQICGLYENVFYIGADAAHFPGSQVRGGIFDEAYMDQLNFPSLETRTQEHFEMLTQVLEEPESLFLMTAQSDYMGKSIDTSHELNTWLGLLPKFMAPAEPISDPRPSFTLKGMHASSLFASQDGILQTRPRSLAAFEDCALKNMLQYGLRLKKPPTERDLFKVSSDLLVRMVEEAGSRFGVSCDQLSREQIETLLTDEFSFARELFAERRKSELDALYAQSLLRMERIFHSLKPLSAMKLTMVPGSPDVQMKEEYDGLAMNIEGPIASSSRNRAVFNLVDTEPSPFVSDSLPQATINLSMQPSAMPQKAFALRYGRGASPVLAESIGTQEALIDGQRDHLRHALVAQNFGEDAQGMRAELASRVPTYVSTQEKLSSQAEQLADSLQKNDIQPYHRPAACQHCPYKTICRNAAQEKE